MTTNAPRKTRCPYCRSDNLRAEPVSKSGFSWHRCIKCGERFTARVVDPPRRALKADLRRVPDPRRHRR